MDQHESPSVLVLLIATDGARWLPDVLRGLRAQRYRPLRVIAVDNASSDGSGDLLAKAFGATRVVTLERRVGYGRALASALKVAADRNLDADAFLLLHDDCMLAKGSIEAMVEQLRDDVGIVGAKLLDWDEPGLLQDIGQTTDRYGRIVTRVERGELDQGQHDGLHEVLYASSAAMMIARGVVEQIGLFDLRYVAMRDDLDLCWRARIAGFRTVVTTDAVGRHVAAAARDERVSPVRGRTRYFGERNVIATLIKNYSLPRMLFAVPATLVASLINVVLFLLSGRRRSALQVLEALQWNVVHLPSTVRLRLRVQRARRVDDRAVTSLMHHGATRLRSQFERAVERVMGDVEEAPEEDLNKPPPTLIERAKAHPTGALILLAIVVGAIGARTAFFTGPMAGLDHGAFPGGPTGFFRSYATGWRGAASGGAGPATPGLLVLGTLSTLTFTSGWLAQRLLLLALPLIGAATMVRLTRALGFEPGLRRVATVAYVLSPLMLQAFGTARMHDLVLAAAAPGLLLPLLRAAGFASGRSWRSIGGGIAGLAITASLAPWALLFVLISTLILAAAAAVGGKPVSLSILRRGGSMIAGALALLFPWSIELFKPGTPLWAGGTERGARMLELLALSPATERIFPLLIGSALVAAGIAGALIAPPERKRVTASLGALGAVMLLAAYAVTRGAPFLAPRPGLLLTGTAVAAALCLAIGYGAARTVLSSRNFGLLHIFIGVVAVLILSMALWGAGWVATGHHAGWGAAEGALPAFIEREAQAGTHFRVLWVAGNAKTASVALTDGEGATMTDYLERPRGVGVDRAQAAVRTLVGGSSETAARTLATLGVRWVIVRADAGDDLIEQVGRDPDLSFFQRFRGARVFRNEVNLPAAAIVRSKAWIAAAAKGSDAAALGEQVVDATPLHRSSPTRYRGPVEGGETVLLAENFDEGWSARVGRRRIGAARSFGWGTRFSVPAGAKGTIRIAWDGQRWHRMALLIQGLIVFAFVIGWSQRAARDRGER